MTQRPRSRHRTFERPEWAALRAQVPLLLAEEEIDRLRGINEHLSLEEVAEIYLPLSRLLHLRAGATRVLEDVTHAFLGSIPPSAPFVIGLGGSVAVGKSTTARVLEALLSRWPEHPRVALVPTDGFLFPNAVLEERNLMERKGFPESYDLVRLVDFLTELKAGRTNRTEVPVYDHLTYDVQETTQALEDPDVVIVEGLNVLQANGTGPHVSDFFDWTLYVDAGDDDIERWYVDRFLTLRETALTDPRSYFHRFSSLSPGEAERFAREVWHAINLPNLVQNILPTRERADLILEKGADHRVARVHLRLM